MSNNNNNFEIKILLFIENLARILYSREGVCKAQRQEVGAARGSAVGGSVGGAWPGEGLKTAKVVTNPLGCFGETAEGE